jgi:hydrogenase maturation protease
VTEVRALVIGLGQPAAGDDGVGIAVLERLHADGVPPGVELRRAVEPTALVELLTVDVPVVLVDAVASGTPGEVLELGPDELAGRGAAPYSTHGLDVEGAIALARALEPRLTPSLRIVAVGITRPPRPAPGLSPAIAAAVPRAAARVRALVGG